MSSDSSTQNVQALEFASAEEDARRRREAIISLFRGRLHWALLLAMILGSAGAIAGYFSQKPIYQGEGGVAVRPEVDSLYDTKVTRTPRMFASYVKSQIGLIGSSEVIERAMVSDTWKQALGDAGAEPMSPAAFGRSLESDLLPRSDYNIVVTFTHPSPAVAKAGVNATLSAYRDVFRHQEDQRTEKKISSINTTLQQLKAEEIQLTNQIAARLSTDELLFRERLSALNEELIIKQRELGATEVALHYYLPSSGNSTTPGLEEFQDPTMLEYDERILQFEADIETMIGMNIGENNRRIRDVKAQINTLNKQKQRYVEQLRSGDGPVGTNTQLAKLRSAEKQLRDQVAKLEAQIDAKDKQLNSIAPLTLQLKTVSERAQGLENNKFVSARDGVSLKERVKIESFSGEPEDPYNAGTRLQLAVLGCIAGSGMGLALVVLVGLLDSRLRHASDAKNGLRDVRMLGVLPSLPDDLADPDQAERAAHAINHIRTLLQISGPNNRVFSITGPAAGSGKSSLTVALGLSFSASGNKVLLIDGDIVGAGLTRRLGAVVNKPFDEVVREDGRVSAMQLEEADAVALRKGINLMDALIEIGALSRDEAEKVARRRSDASLGILDVCHGADIHECIAETGIPRLYVLPVGNARPEDAGLLSPKTIRAVLTAARENFDIVLIDTGPVLGSLEASMAGAEADGTVLIVSRGDSKGIATRSLEHLQSVGARIAGIVFNHALETDLGETSYGSMVSQDRRGQAAVQVDPAAAARFGPLGSAVATYGPAAALRQSETNGRSLIGASNGRG